MIKIDRASLLFSANCLVASLLALWVGFSLDLPRPYWAVMTVYIVSQPLAGAVRSKAIFRVMGTLLGASFAVLTVPVLVNTPPLLSLVMALWVGGCLFVSLLDRTPRAYVLMLAGYTATLIAFPTVNHPELIFDVAVSRVEEIVLGILCATLTHSLIFPRPVGAVLQQRLNVWLAEADGWATEVLRNQDPNHNRADRRHLAAAASEIHMLSVLLPFDTSAMRDTGTVVRAIHQRLLVLIPVLSGIADRLRALKDNAALLKSELDVVADWIEGGADSSAMPGLAQRLADAKIMHMGGDWNTLLRESLLERVQDLMTNLGEAHALLVHLHRPDEDLAPDLAAAVAAQKSRPLHRDWGMAAISALSATLSILVACTLWIVSGWPEGGVAAAMAGVFCALFAALDDPAPAIVGFGIFSTIAIPVAALYQFGILPMIDGFPMLALVLAPILLLVGSGMTGPKTALPSLSFLLGFSNALALTETFSADFASFVNVNTAQYVALWVALLITRTMRSMSVDAAARRLLKLSWSKLAVLAQQDRSVDLHDLAAQLVDRLGLITPKLALAAKGGGLEVEDVLSDVRIAMNLAMLQQNRGALSPRQSASLDKVMTQVGTHFSERAQGRAAHPGAALLTALNDCLEQIATIRQAERRVGVTALVGLRSNLFPDAEPFQARASV